MVPNAHEPERPKIALNVPELIESFHTSDEQQARFGRKPLDLQSDALISVAEHKLRSAHDIARPIRKLSARPFLVRAERNHARTRFEPAMIDSLSVMRFERIS